MFERELGLIYDNPGMAFVKARIQRAPGRSFVRTALAQQINQAVVE